MTDHHFSAAVLPADWRFDASHDMPLLQSASRAGVTLPASCRNGTCRTCMCRLQSGKVSYRIEWPGLTREEKQEGFILPCVAYPESDVVIDAPAASRMPAK